MSNEVPGLERFAAMMALATVGPYSVDYGTVTDKRNEIVAGLCTPEDARAIEALLHIKDELVVLLKSMQALVAIHKVNPNFGVFNGDLDLMKAILDVNERLIKWNKSTTEME